MDSTRLQPLLIGSFVLAANATLACGDAARPTPTRAHEEPGGEGGSESGGSAGTGGTRNRGGTSSGGEATGGTDDTTAGEGGAGGKYLVQSGNCEGQGSIDRCIRLTATPNESFSDPEVGVLWLDSTGDKGCDGTAPSRCWQ